MPLRRSLVPWGPDMTIYRRLAYGDLAEFNILDTRQYRDDQADGDGVKPPSPQSLARVARSWASSRSGDS